MKRFLNRVGALALSGAVLLPAALTGAAHYFGLDHNNAVYSTGSLDEIRISTAARSTDSIKTEYNNQSSPASFIAVGPQQNAPGGGTAARTAVDGRK